MKGLSFPKRKRGAKRKHYIEFDPRRFWVVLLCLFVLAIAFELIFFSVMFLRTSKRIDAPANPTLETNRGKIKEIQTTLDKVEEALEQRTGKVNIP